MNEFHGVLGIDTAFWVTNLQSFEVLNIN